MRKLKEYDMDFVCKNCGKPHGEMIHLSCLRELESDTSEVKEVILEE